MALIPKEFTKLKCTLCNESKNNKMVALKLVKKVKEILPLLPEEFNRNSYSRATYIFLRVVPIDNHQGSYDSMIAFITRCMSHLDESLQQINAVKKITKG